MNEFEKLIAREKPVLVAFIATSCAPCMMSASVLAVLKKQVGDSATIIKIDVDRNQQLAMNYGIQSVPTLMLFKRGELLWRASGVQRAADLAELLGRYA